MLSDEIKKVNRQIEICKNEAKKTMFDAIRSAMLKFHEQTGLYITDVDVTVITHANRQEINGVMLTDLTLHHR